MVEKNEQLENGESPKNKNNGKRDKLEKLKKTKNEIPKSSNQIFHNEKTMFYFEIKNMKSQEITKFEKCKSGK